MRMGIHEGRWVDGALAVIAAMLLAGMLAAAMGHVSSLRSYHQMVIGKAKAWVVAPPRQRSGTFIEYPLVY